MITNRQIGVGRVLAHQLLDNELIGARELLNDGEVSREERLGGLLSFHRRAA